MEVRLIEHNACDLLQYLLRDVRHTTEYEYPSLSTLLVDTYHANARSMHVFTFY
jgi:hypothetical protein